MISFATLLRAVNVGSRRTVAMAELGDLFSRLGMPDVHPLLNSGDVVFRCGPRNRVSFERLFESGA